MAATEGKGITMGEMVIFDDGTATVMGGEFEEPQDIVIYCDLCNEPVAITPEANDQVFVTCLRCHAVSQINIKTNKEPDEPTES
jgi:hypothetical protein